MGETIALHRIEELGHEAKYLLPAGSAAAASVLLRGVAAPERPHAAGVIDTVYFDDPHLRSYEEKRASDFLKTKFRLRWYDGDGTVFLECKQRLGTRRRKLRASVPLAAGELARGSLAALDRVPLTGFAAALGVALADDLVPTLHLRYSREHFVAPDGARLCLDQAIEALAAAPWLGGRRGPVRLTESVFEVKGTRRELPPGCAALATLGARRASFSKYARCLEALVP